jgi:hypothetical protein
VRDLKLLREPCFCYLRTINVLQYWHSVEKSVKIACHVVISNNAINSLPTLQILSVIVVLFEKIYDGEPILVIFSVIEEDLHSTPLFHVSVYDVKSVSQPETMPI